MNVFVTVGNALVPFDRLLRMVDAALPEGAHGVCQHGVSELRPRGLTPVPFLARADFDRALGEADVVVCHAGVGTLWSAIAAGHRPVVVPRRASHGEIVNDHQLEICAALEVDGLIRVVGSSEELAGQMRESTRVSAPRSSPRDRLEPIARAFHATLHRDVRRRRWLLALLKLAAPGLDRLRVR